jgi:hypothetical protein
LATSSISSTGEDLYDEGVMGLLLEDDFGGGSQKSRNGSTDDVFLTTYDTDTNPRTISIIKSEGGNLRPQSARSGERNSTSEDIDDGFNSFSQSNVNVGRLLVQPRRFAIYVGNLTWVRFDYEFVFGLI